MDLLSIFYDGQNVGRIFDVTIECVVLLHCMPSMFLPLLMIILVMHLLHLYVAKILLYNIFSL